MKPYNNDEFSNYLVESTSQFFDRYGKMYGENSNLEEEEKPAGYKKVTAYDLAYGTKRALNQLEKNKGSKKRWTSDADRGELPGRKKPGLLSRAKSAVKKVFNREDYEVLDYILSEGYANSIEEAIEIYCELDEEVIDDILSESSAGYTSREYATRREKDISRLKGKIGAYKKGAGPQDKAKDAMVSDIRAMRAQRKVTGDKLSGKEAENRKTQRLAQAKRMADKRRESEAASKKKGLASRAKSAIKKMFNKEDYDVYDVVLQYILDEGYAVSFQEAFGIMSELDEDTILDILEETGYEYIED